MSYTKTTWVDGDIISAEKLNKIENGIVAAQESVPDIKINGTSIVDDGVANIPYASLANAGVVKIEPDDGGYFGMGINSAGFAFLKPAGSNEIKAGEMYTRRPIIPSTQHESVFYGLAKASGDTTQSQSSNAVGTYTDAAKGAIKSMLGVNVDDVQIDGTSVVTNGIADIPIVTSNGSVQLGLVKPMAGLGTAVATNGGLAVVKANDSQIKTGTNEYAPIVPQKQHASVFYGLAKLAGVDMKNSSNSVGQYTDDAKIAIQKMLGIYEPPWQLIYEETTTENLETLSVTVDSNGDPFELIEMFTRVWLPPSLTETRNYIKGNTYAKYDNQDNVSWTSLSTLGYINATDAVHFDYHHTLFYGICKLDCRNSTNGSTNTQNWQGMTFPDITSTARIESINGIRLQQYNTSSTLIPAGTIIKVYGRRKWT